MSWFDATGFANLAKSALKEAQKTIDKALDIKEEDGQPVVSSKPTSSNSIEDTDFFDTWGLKNSDSAKSGESKDASTLSPSKAATGKPIKDGPSGIGKMAVSTSLWGSFTGSFFDNPSTGEGGEPNLSTIAMQPKKSSSLGHDPSLSLLRKTSWEQGGDLLSEEDASEFGFSQSKLVVESEDGDADARSRLSSCEADEDRADDSFARHSNLETLSMYEEDSLPAAEARANVHHLPSEAVVMRRRDHTSSTSSYKFNRLSVISSESDKRSSESVEVLGYGSGFTTTPESPSYSGTSSGFRVSVAASTPESVEVIPDTPSSVEVLGEHSARSSLIAVSPFLSPVDPPDPPNSLSISLQSDKINLDLMSPESVEVIPEEEEDEEDRSMADDSYASASESTATGTITMVEQPHFMLVKSDTVDSIKSLKSPHHKVYFAETPTKIGLASMMDSYNEKLHNEEPVLTHANRAGLTLPLPQMSDLVNEGIDRLKVSESSNEDSMISDKTLVGIDSSYEGTIGSDDTTGTTVAEDSSSDSAGTSSLRRQPQQEGSIYVKTMLAEAMGEEESKMAMPEYLVLHRDHSPISSESRSDMVKIESEQTSGHTSGDEIETTTSSDIEIISSPNGGDSSSTQSARHSPAKLLQQVARGKLLLAGDRSDSPALDLLGKIGGKIKGHQRELSETSSGGSEDSHCSEVERLVRRIAEMSEILEARESKLIDLSRSNVELLETNAELKSQLQSTMLTHVGTQDLQKLNDDFTQRLSALERKFQQAVREKEALRQAVEAARTEAAGRTSAGELEAALRERDEVIEELRREGGKLSKQELQHSNIIKKLRVKEKESDTVVAKQKDQLEDLSQEVDRLKRSLAAKEEVERTQIEAVHQLTAKAKRQEKELTTVKSQLDDASQKMITLNTSLEAASKELSACRLATASKDKELKEASTARSARQELESALEEAKMVAQREQDQLVAQVQDLQEKLRRAQEDHSVRESQARQECADLLRRLEEAEARNEELAQSVSVVTRPLLRQIESLQAAHSAQQASWEKQERNLTENIGDLQGRLALVTEQERSSREQCISLRSRAFATETRLAAANQESARLRDEAEGLASQCSQLRQEKDREVSEREALLKADKDRLHELRREVTALEQQLAIERTATEAEKRKTSQLQEQLREADRQVGRGSPTTPQSSPTLSFGRASLSDSISSAIWPQFQEDAFENGSTSGRYNVYDSLRTGNTTSMLEGLQSQLKLREGEVQQLQWDLGRREAERSALTAELSALTARVEDQERRLVEAAEVGTRYEEVQQRYDALLQMYGEKVEEAQELRLDLQDVKEMYKTQIDQLLKKESLQDM